jgi:Polyketide cyclase / dehydrase and lipid transport
MKGGQMNGVETTTWTREHSIETTASALAVWRLWADVPGWGKWNADIERIELDGPFAAGSVITMTPRGQDPVVLRIGELVENELFVDEAEIDDVVIRTHHLIEPIGDERIRIVYRIEISGPGAGRLGPELGPQISADFPDTLAELARLAALES